MVLTPLPRPRPRPPPSCFPYDLSFLFSYINSQRERERFCTHHPTRRGFCFSERKEENCMTPMPPLFLLQLHVLFAITILIITVSCLNPEGLSLLSLKAALSSPAFPDPLPDWNESDTNPCRWYGVSCATITVSAAPRVVAVSIQERNLSGYLPSELGALLYLRRLNLHGNRLSGSISPSLLNATSLHSIFLGQNRLSGEIPSGICLRLPRLQNLDLSGNILSGILPLDLPSCRQLQRLLLAENGLSGHLPSGIGSLDNLVQLDLSSNSFNGSLPPDLGRLSALSSTLNLSYNAFSGRIPAALGRLPVAVSLDLRANHLSGPIPIDGSLSNQGPTAFLQNPDLCGFPLQNPCRNPNHTYPEGSRILKRIPKRKSLSSAAIIAISVGAAAVVAAIGLAIALIYRRRRQAGRKGCSCRGNDKFGKKEWCCIFSGESPEKGIGGGAACGGGGGKLVAVDRGFELDLDELLRASAYVLGKGGRGIVYKVVVGNGIRLVVRRLGSEGNAQKRREFVSQVQLIGRIRHPNIVRVRAYYWAPDEKLIVSDFIPNGNLASALHGRRSGHPSANLSWSSRLKIAKGTASGLAHIHECSPRKYAHGDIKPSNILLDSNFNPYISDFGLNRLVTLAGSEPSFGARYVVGALPLARACKGVASDPVRTSKSFGNCYKAPEVRANGSKPTQKSDVYSFGVVLLELITGRSPISKLASVDMEMVDWVRKVFKEGIPLSEVVDPILLPEVHAKKEVLSVFHIGIACMDPDPEFRPRMKTVLESLEKIETPSPTK